MNSADKPRLIVVAGPNGSGKTSITSAMLEHTWMAGCQYVNPDNIARDIFGSWNEPDSVIKAANLAQDIRERCLNNGESLAFETVLSSPDKVDFIQRAKQAGFFVRLFFVGTDHPSINASRIARRVMGGGHDVPISKIISRYRKSMINAAIVASMADRSYFYDNSVEYAEPQLLLRLTEGMMVKCYQPTHVWAQQVMDMMKIGTFPSDSNISGTKV